MNLDYINEAFRSLDMLTEDLFKADTQGIQELSDFHSAKNDEKISIIDMDATTEDDLQDSYVGKVIIDCNICHSHIFKDKSDINFDAEGMVELDRDCPYCGENNGFVIIGEIHEFNPNETESQEDSEIEEPVAASEDAEEGEIEADDIVEALTEDFKNISLETDNEIMTMTSEDNGKVTVTTEPVQNMQEGETIAPISAETESEILDANAEETFEEPVEASDSDMPEEEIDVDIEEIDDDSLSELGESYLKRVYENVDSFKLTSCSSTPKQLVVEGLITFKSGATKNTGFIFEAKQASRDGKLKFVGENAHLSRGRKAFTLVGSMNESKKFIAESFTYNYRAKAGDGSSSRVYGKVNRNK